MQRILVIKHGAFGDVIQADGVLRDIRAHHKEAEIVMLTTPAFRQIFERSPHVDRVLLDPRAPRWRLDLMRKLKAMLVAEKFDMVYDLQNTPRTAFYFRWFLPNTKWSGTAKGCSHPHKAINPKSIPAIERMVGQLQDAGVPVVHARTPDVSWMADDVSTLLQEAGVTGKYIMLIPGCSARHPHKRWPHYEALARQLISEGHTIVTGPGPDEIPDAYSFPGAVIKGPQGFIKWFGLAGLLKGASFVVGNDTGPSHLASHLGVPGFALFGPHTTAERTSILRSNFSAIEVPDLAALPLERVLGEIKAQLAA